MELVFGKLQKFRKKKSLVNDEEFQVRYECWFWFDRGWNWTGQIGQLKIVIINIDRFQVGLTFANFGKTFFKLTMSGLISNIYIAHRSENILDS